MPKIFNYLHRRKIELIMGTVATQFAINIHFKVAQMNIKLNIGSEIYNVIHSRMKNLNLSKLKKASHLNLFSDYF